MLACSGVALSQQDLLPLDHPATTALVRIYEGGGIPEFPREHLPIPRGVALRFLDEAAADATLPASLRDLARYHAVELGVDLGRTQPHVFIPTSTAPRWVLEHPFDSEPLSVVDYRDSALGLHVGFEPIGELEARVDPSSSDGAFLAQGGFQLRGSMLGLVGFSARITNGTIVGDSTIFLRDPRYKRSGKFGQLGQGRDVDFGSGHVRVDGEYVWAEIGRELVQLGAGVDESLLVGASLPSRHDWVRLGARVGKVSFTHLHTSVLADLSTTGGVLAGFTTEVPNKYVAAHLLSVGPFAGFRLSIGESVVYSNRPFEIGYLNPLNFMKSQEHFLRDRDNSNMYGSLSWRSGGLFLEGELLLDDLKFSEIGDGYWGNKTAWRIGAKGVGVPLDVASLGIAYTRFEPYVFTHFNEVNTYTHDGAVLAGAFMEPNSDLIEGRVTIWPTANLTVTLRGGVLRHGANVYQRDSLGRALLDSVGRPIIARNVGGDVRQTRRYDDSYTVSFLDGDLERSLRLRLEIEYEPIRNVYLRATAFRTSTDAPYPVADDMQLWLGVRVGAH